MKQMKVLVLSLIVLMGVGLTSCMDSDDNTTLTGFALVKVRNSLGVTFFEDANGFKLYPSMVSLSQMEAAPNNFKTSSTHMAYIGYQYDSATQPTTANTTKLNVDLVYAVSLDATYEVVDQPGASNDSINKAPIISLKGTIDGSYTYKPVMYDDTNTLLLSINYYMSKDNHTFTLVRYRNGNAQEEGNAEDGNTITMYLRHNNVEDNSINATSLAYSSRHPSVFYKAFNLSSLGLSAGDKLIIKTMESNSSVKLEDAKEVDYEILIGSEE